MALSANSQFAHEPNPARANAVRSLGNLLNGIGVLVVVGIIIGVIVTGPA